MSGNIECLSAALELVSEPTAIADMGKIIYLNPSARKFTGLGGTGFPSGELLPPHVLNCQAPMFVTGGEIAGHGCAIRADVVDGTRVYIFTPDEELSAPGLFSVLPVLRVELANLKLASDRIVSMASASGDEKFPQYSAVLSNSYYQLKRLVQNISVIDGLLNGGLPFSPAAADLAEICGDIVSAVAPFAERSGIEIKFDGSGPAVAVADRELIELMVLNLITNSLSHTSAGGYVKLGVSQYPGGIMLSVDDSGSGIDPEIMKNIFSRYRQTLSFSDMADGAGLGLAIARGIAEKHGGALIIESRKNSGVSVRASISGEIAPSGRFNASEASYIASGMDTILTQLSPWLIPEGYSQKYAD